MSDEDVLLIGIPTYNESANIKELYDRLRKVAPKAVILFVDDNSPDGSSEIISDLCNSDAKVILRKRDSKLGIGSAHKEIFVEAKKSNCDCLVTLDADLTHRPEDVPRLLDHLRTNDVVVASRFEGGVKSWVWYRRFLTRFGHLLTRVLLGVKHDATGAFRAYSKRVIDSQIILTVEANGYSFFFESLFALSRSGASIGSVSTVLDRRAQGNSKMTLGDLSHGLTDLIRIAARRSQYKRSPYFKSKVRHQ